MSTLILAHGGAVTGDEIAVIGSGVAVVLTVLAAGWHRARRTSSSEVADGAVDR